MAKNGQKMAEIFLGASHMINNNIFSIFCFSTFFLGYFWDPVFKAIFLKFIQNAGLVKYPREKVEKQKMLKMLLLIIYEPPKKISTIFWPFTWKNCQIETRFRLLLVNNQLCSIPPSGAPLVIKIIAGETCEWSVLRLAGGGLVVVVIVATNFNVSSRQGFKLWGLSPWLPSLAADFDKDT